jgi:hypothetical protein
MLPLWGKKQTTMMVVEYGDQVFSWTTQPTNQQPTSQHRTHTHTRTHTTHAHTQHTQHTHNTHNTHTTHTRTHSIVMISQFCTSNVAHTDPSAPYLARHVALKSGCAIRVPALTVNRLCGSGFQAVVNGAQNILLGESEVVLTAGAENMSLAPYLLSGPSVRWGSGLGTNLQMVDSLWVRECCCCIVFVLGLKQRFDSHCCLFAFIIGHTHRPIRQHSHGNDRRKLGGLTRHHTTIM